MKFFLRHFLPITYFQATRLNRWVLVGYNGLVEWIPALALSYYYSDFRVGVFWTVIVSYVAFISVYEIGYITNDYFSESFEEDPRGRAENIRSRAVWIWGLMAARVMFFLLFTHLADAWGNALWWTFHGALAATFALHNSLPKDLRIPTFFGLSTFRYFAPMILTLSLPVLTILLPTILLNNSLYRITVYLGNKNVHIAANRETLSFKLAFYLGCLPLSVLLSVLFQSWLPMGIWTYYICVWISYWLAGRLAGSRI